MWSWIVNGALLVISLLVLLILKIAFKKDNFPSLKGPPKKFFFGNFLDLVKHGKTRHQYFTNLCNAYGGTVKLRVLSSDFIATTNQDVIKDVLVNNRVSFHKTKVLKNAFDEVPHSIFTVDGEEWKMRRELLNPKFGIRHLKNSYEIIVEKCVRLVNQWEEALSKSGGSIEVDVANRFGCLTLDIICFAGFGEDIKSLEDPNSSLTQNINSFFDGVDRRFIKVPPQIAGYWKYFQTKEDIKMKKASEYLRNFLSELLEKRKKEDTSEKGDLLSLMIEVDPPLETQVIISDVTTFLLAGNHTTAMTLSWTLSYLSSFPELQKKVQKEVDEVLKGSNPTYENLNELKYSTAFIREVMRIKPVAWLMTRQAVEDVTINQGKLFIPKGTIIGCNIYGVHHNPDYWTDPEVFNPDRFLAEDSHTSWNYLPFSKGIRNCIGQRLALLELQIGVAVIMQRFNLSLTEGHSVSDKVAFALIPDDLIVTFQKRT